MTTITRHMLTVPAQAGQQARRVHYRRCGTGPALLMVHQSPRSSAEYEEMMRRWGAQFTCIAPDTPGFGQSDPLEGEPEIDAFADALIAFCEAVGIGRCPAYGFHSGGVILVAATKRQPSLFSALAIGGYAVWTEAELAWFGDRYLPEWHPAPYGEHLTWLWNRILEQSWYFPWFDARDEARLPVANADPMRVHRSVMEMLDSGNAYRAGYGAVLRAPRSLPAAGPELPPALITAFEGDPLRPHLDRLTDLPPGWSAQAVSTSGAHQDASLAFLQEHAGSAPCPPLVEDAEEGWLALDHGLVHWRGTRDGEDMFLHAPAAELRTPPKRFLTIDVPGHGHSDPAPDIDRAILQTAQALGAARIVYPPLPPGDPQQLYPDMTPDRFGHYLTAAWSAARAEAIFAPWYDAGPAAAIPIEEAALAPVAIHRRARARIRAGDAAARYHHMLQQQRDRTG